MARSANSAAGRCPLARPRHSNDHPYSSKKIAHLLDVQAVRTYIRSRGGTATTDVQGSERTWLACSDLA
jgi:hypothetical protein